MASGDCLCSCGFNCWRLEMQLHSMQVLKPWISTWFFSASAKFCCHVSACPCRIGFVKLVTFFSCVLPNKMSRQEFSCSAGCFFFAKKSCWTKQFVVFLLWLPDFSQNIQTTKTPLQRPGIFWVAEFCPARASVIMYRIANWNRNGVLSTLVVAVVILAAYEKGTHLKY